MQTSLISFMIVSFLSMLPHLAIATICPPDAVPVGPTCVDKYEASVWRIFPNSQALVERVRQGVVRREELLNGGAIQLGVTQDDYDLVGCQDTANRCTGIYAVSVTAVQPSSHLTWFQAAAACRNAGKRLLRNAEWQMAAFGPQEESACNTGTEEKQPTGSPSCRADSGAYDLIGNVSELVAEWLQGSSVQWTPSTGTAGSAFGEDAMAGTNPTTSSAASEQNFPSAVRRGGEPHNSTAAGVFALVATTAPSQSFPIIGFRCAR